jgi:murein DD-endopeptidase MepM/ murein hydrolase activator NlpD
LRKHRAKTPEGVRCRGRCLLTGLAAPGAAAAAYGWPVKPFDKQHAVRSFFDDPRAEGTGLSSFHFGIDISGRDGAAVYAVAGVSRPARR